MHSLNTRDLKAAYKQADGKKLDNRRVLVDVERGRTVPNWRPHRLGSGLGTTRIGGMTSIKSILGGRGKDLMKGEESESGRNLVSVLMTNQGIVIIGARKRYSTAIDMIDLAWDLGLLEDPCRSEPQPFCHALTCTSGICSFEAGKRVFVLGHVFFCKLFLDKQLLAQQFLCHII